MNMPNRPKKDNAKIMSIGYSRMGYEY